MSLSFVPKCVSFDIQVFQTGNDVRTPNLLVDLLESIELLLNHLDIYTKIPPTTFVTEIVVKTLVELLSILALATSLVEQGRPGAFLLADDLPNSMQCRDIRKYKFWKGVC